MVEAERPDVQLSWYTIDGGGGVSADDWLVLVGAVSRLDGTGPLLVAGDVCTDSLWALWDFPADSVAGTAAVRITQLALAPISPNPSRGMTGIVWSQPVPSHVRLTVYDVQGRAVAVLANGSYEAGRHDVTWRVSGGHGGAAAGIYLVRLETMQRVLTRRIVIMP